MRLKDNLIIYEYKEYYILFHNMQIISLGSSCDTTSNLKRIGINVPTLFFDYIWNEYDGLRNVIQIIQDKFIYFNDIMNYEKTTTHPVLTWDSFNINKYYPTFVFMHHDTEKQHIIDSLNRKIDRTMNALSSNEMKVFIYYRHCDTCVDIIKESIDFCEMYRSLYNDNFYLLSLITYDTTTNINIINRDLETLRMNNNKYLQFDFVYRRNDTNDELNNIAVCSWNNIFKKYNLNIT